MGQITSSINNVTCQIFNQILESTQYLDFVTIKQGTLCRGRTCKKTYRNKSANWEIISVHWKLPYVYSQIHLRFVVYLIPKKAALNSIYRMLPLGRYISHHDFQLKITW